jgi:hypothetical protein
MLRTFVLFTCILFTSCGTDTAVVSDEEALAAGKKLEAMIKGGDVEGITAFFDEPSVYALMTEKSRASRVPKVMDQFRSANNIMRYAELVVKGAKRGDFSLLRNDAKENGSQRLVFRVIGAGGGTAYYDFYLKKVKSKVKVVDVMTYESGDVLSSVMAEQLDLAVEGGDQVNLFMQKKNNGDLEATKEIYRQLPLEMQQTKLIMTVYIDACQKTNDSNYTAAVENFTRLYPVSPGACLLVIDASEVTGDYEKGLLAINKLDAFVGGDPFLDHKRGSMYQFMDKPAESIPFFEKVYASFPEHTRNLRSLITAYVAVKDLEKANKMAAVLKAAKTLREEDQRFLQEYAELMNRIK